MIISLIFIPMSMAKNEEDESQINSINKECNSYLEHIGDWYFLPGYPNYSPNGIPDFDQRQDDTWRNNFRWSFCGPAALANIIWWFDSKNSDPKGFVGDGIDNYTLVQNFNPPGNPEPGPFLDDHNYNNVNDIETSWVKYSNSGELIERLASYVNIYWHKIPFFTVSGTDRFQLSFGAKKWIKDAGLENDYKIENIFRPSFSLIDERVRNNDGIILRLGYYLPSFPILFPLIFLHYVTVAGINSNGYIAVSDPEWDIANPSSDPTLHNNPSIVSHDIYEVDFSSPYPQISSWWIPSFERHRRVLVIAAIIISEID
ncbi:hypothetical protein ACFL1L_00355 [Thermoplasmatota archaeon]